MKFFFEEPDLKLIRITRWCEVYMFFFVEQLSYYSYVYDHDYFTYVKALSKIHHFFQSQILLFYFLFEFEFLLFAV